MKNQPVSLLSLIILIPVFFIITSLDSALGAGSETASFTMFFSGNIIGELDVCG